MDEATTAVPEREGGREGERKRDTITAHAWWVQRLEKENVRSEQIR